MATLFLPRRTPTLCPSGAIHPSARRWGLYAEQISGTAFTAPRASNLHTWMYRILPSVRHMAGLTELPVGQLKTAPCRDTALPAAQLRWHPVAVPTNGAIDFLASLTTITTCGDAALQTGIATRLRRKRQHDPPILSKQ